jgi:hypothetical protein
MTGSTKRMVLAGAFAALGYGWHKSVEACSPPPPKCVQLPPDGATFPANAVAFRLHEDRSYSGFEESLALRIEEGSVAVAASAKRLPTGERVFSPDGPLEPGRRYVLSYQSGSCFPVTGRPVPLADFAFLTTEPLTYPTNAGALDVGSHEVIDPARGTRRAYVKLSLVESLELKPFRGLRTYRVTMDDRLLHNLPVGTSGDIFIPNVCPDSGWKEGPCGHLTSVPTGRYRVKVSPHVLGGTSMPPLEREIEISCVANSSSLNTPLPTPSDPNPPAGREGETAAEGSPAGAATETQGAAACSIAAASRSNSGVGLVLSLALVAWGFLQRRTRRCLSSRR